MMKSRKVRLVERVESRGEMRNLWNFYGKIGMKETARNRPTWA
jgi:hypothetical protein